MDNPFNKTKEEDKPKIELKIEVPVIAPPRKEPNERNRILTEEFGGLESNVPLNHIYWKLPRG